MFLSPGSPPTHSDQALTRIILLVVLAGFLYWVGGRFGFSPATLSMLRKVEFAVAILLILGGAMADDQPGGTTKRRVLEKDQALNGILLKKGTAVEVSGKLFPWNQKYLKKARLESPQSINGLSLAGDVEFDYQISGAEAHLKLVTLAADQEIEGIPCAAGRPIELDIYDDKLKTCVLGRPLKMGAFECPPGSEFSAGPNQCRIERPAGAEPLHLEDVVIPPHCHFEYGGQPPHLLAVNMPVGFKSSEGEWMEVNGVRLTARIVFHDDGTVEGMRWDDPALPESENPSTYVTIPRRKPK